jgi:hypothetical protein
MATKLHFPSQKSEWTDHRYHKKEFDLGAAWAKHKKLLDEEVERRKDWKPGYCKLNENPINDYHERELNNPA